MPTIVSRSIDATTTGESKMAYLIQKHGWGSAANTFAIRESDDFTYSLNTTDYFLVPTNCTKIKWIWGASDTAGADFLLGFKTAELINGTQTTISDSQITITEGTTYYENTTPINIPNGAKFICMFFEVPTGVVNGPWNIALLFS